MTSVVLSPDGMRRYISRLEEDGIKAFVISDVLDGSITSPTKKKPFFRIPGGIGRGVFKTDDVSNIVFKGTVTTLYFTDDLEHLSELANEKLHQVTKGGA